MATSGARSGTRPGRGNRGAGSGTVGPTALGCGHETHLEAAVTKRGPIGQLYLCPHGCGLVKRATRRTNRKEERRDSYGDKRRSPERE